LCCNKFAHENGRIQLVFKDWPIFGGNSTYAARLGLAAKYQNKYFTAQEALISVQRKMTKENVPEAGTNISRLKRDLATGV
jgi:protein-disulfide isomerase